MLFIIITENIYKAKSLETSLKKLIDAEKSFNSKRKGFTLENEISL